jgi:hypothetical protein
LSFHGFNVFDDQDRIGPLLQVQFEPDLFFKRIEQSCPADWIRGAGCFRGITGQRTRGDTEIGELSRIDRCESKRKVPRAFQTGPFHDGMPHIAGRDRLKQVDKLSHRDVLTLDLG